MRPCPVFVAVALLAGCQPPRPGTAAVAYRCDDGRRVQAGYADPDHAVLAIDGATRRLTIARSASGARYVGEGWQWWTKGGQAWLAPLRAGETIASRPGIACRQTPGS